MELAPQGKRKKRRKRTEPELVALKKEFLRLYAIGGNSTHSLAKKLDFTRTVIYKWIETDPEFAVKFEQLKCLKDGKDAKTWEKKHGKDEEYKKTFLKLYADPAASVANVLPKISKKLDETNVAHWRKTDPKFEQAFKELQQLVRPRLSTSIQKRISNTKKAVAKKQERFLGVYRTSLFSITEACKELNIPRARVMTWKTTDPDFEAALLAIEDERVDFLEHSAMKLVKEGNVIMNIFALKCKGGWEEKPRHDKLTVEIKHDKETLDAVVRGAQLNRSGYYERLGLKDPTIIDAEYEAVPVAK
jgi:hypothetical protein